MYIVYMDIPFTPLILFRILKGASLPCLMALLFSGKPLRAAELCRTTGFGSHSVTAALELLEALGLATHDSHRSQWQLTIDAAAELCGWVLAANAPPDDSPAAPASQARLADCAPDEDMRGKLTFQSADRESRSEAVVKLTTVGVVNLIKPLNKLTTTTVEVANHDPVIQVPQVPVPQVLSATERLFGERVMGPPERYGDGRELLASIAQAYTYRSQLRKPARVVYANLKRGALPPLQYLQDPCAYLPPDFLTAAGLRPADKPCKGGLSGASASVPAEELPPGDDDESQAQAFSPSPQEKDGESQADKSQAQPDAFSPSPQGKDGESQAQPDALSSSPQGKDDESQAEAFSPSPQEEDGESQAHWDASLLQPVDPGGRRTALQAWEMAVEEVLSKRMDGNARDRLLYASLVRFESPGVFIVRAASEYDCEWLTSRLVSTLTRLLIGICAREVEVRFISTPRVTYR